MKRVDLEEPTTSETATVSGVYGLEVRPFIRRRFTIVVLYRNFEIDCPSCGQYIGVVALSLVRAEFGVWQRCDLCRHRFIYHFAGKRNQNSELYGGG